MPFHIEKKHPQFGTLYYTGNLQWNKNKDKRFLYETEEGACCDCNNLRGTIVEEA